MERRSAATQTKSVIKKKVTKKSTFSGQGSRVERLLEKAIEQGQVGVFKVSNLDLERALGSSACKRLADYLEDCLEESGGGVGGIC